MFIELLQPMEFGTGAKKVGEVINVAHTMAEDLIRSGRATWPRGTQERKDKDKKANVGDQMSAKSSKSETTKTTKADNQ